MAPVLATEAELTAAVIAAKYATSGYVTAICGKIDNDEGKLVGSGTFVSLGGDTYLLTADHVIIQRRQLYEDLVRRSTPSPVPIGYCARSEYRLDLSLAYVGNDTSIIPAPAQLLAASSSNVDDEHLFVQGFPETQSRFTAFGPAVMSDSQPYVTYTHVGLWPGYFDPAVHFAIEYPAPEVLQIDERGRPHALPPANGMSGCAVWSLSHSVGAGWSPEQARIVGVAHRWDPVSQSLIVTRIEAVREFLLKVVRERRAFQLWQSRGAPWGDPLTDWVRAEGEVLAL